MARKLAWYALDVLILVMLWMGLVHGVQGALNVGLMFVWLLAGAATAVVLCGIPPDDGPALRREPIWDVAHTCAVVCLLVWHDWFVSGLAYLAAHVILVVSSRCHMTLDEWDALERARARAQEERVAAWRAEFQDRERARQLTPSPMPPRPPGA